MFCTKCGNSLSDTAKFCSKCGSPVIPLGQPQQPQQAEPQEQQPQPQQLRQAEPQEQQPQPQQARQAEPQEQQPQPQQPRQAESQVQQPQPQQPRQAESQEQQLQQAEPQVQQPQQNWQQQYTGYQQPVGMPPKKKSILPKIAVAGVAVAAIAAAGVFGHAHIANFIRLHTMSPKAYYAYVEKKNISGVADAFYEAYDRGYDLIKSRNYGYEQGFSIEIGEQVAKLVSMSGIDISKLKSIEVYSHSGVKDSEVTGVCKFKINGTDIINAELYFDTKSGEYYIKCPEINDGYIDCTSLIKEAYGEASEELEEYYSMIDGGASPYAEGLFGAFDKAADYLPKPDALRGVTDELTDDMLDACDDVKRSSEQLKVGSISAKYTTLEVNLDGEAYYQAIKNALDTAEDNKGIKEYMQRLGELTGEADLYDKYLDGLKDGREELGDGSEVKESDATFFMKVYVDSVGEIKGREITVSGSGESVTFTNLMPQKGSAYEYESRFTLNGTEYYKITGDGKRSGGKLKGNFGFNLNPELMPSEISSYIYSMSDVLTMEIKDLDENKLEKGLLSGKFSFSTSIPIVSVYSLDLDIDQAEKGGSFKITCRQADDILASVSSTIKQKGAPKVDKPKSGDRLYDASSGEDMMEYVGNYQSLYSIINKISDLTGINIMSLLGGAF